MTNRFRAVKRPVMVSVMGGSERVNPQHCFSHSTAAQLYCLPLPFYASRDTTVHVSARSPRRAPSGAGITGHRLASPRWVTRELVLRDVEADQLFAFSVVTPEHTWAQMAETLDMDDLIAMGDAIVGGSTNPDIRGAGPLATLSDLHQVVHLYRGFRGAKKMLAAIGHVRVGSLSRPESLLRVMLVRAGLPEPLPNRRVYDLAGRLIWIPDLCWPEFRVLVEYQGDGHRASKAKFRGDIARLEEYTDGWWSAAQASADDVFGDPNPFAARMWRRLVTAGWDPKRRQLRHIAGARA